MDHQTKPACVLNTRSILIVTGEFPTSSHTFVLDQVCGLIDRGVKVRVLAMRPYYSIFVPPEFETYHLENLTHYVTPLEKRGTDRKVLFCLALLLRQKRLRLVFEFARLWLREKVLGIAVPDKLDTLSYALAMTEIPDPDFVLCHFGQFGDLMTRVRAALNKKWPIGTIFHGYDISALVGSRGQIIYRRLFSLGDLFFPVSEDFAHRLKELGASRRKVRLLRMGIKSGLGSCKPRTVGKDLIFTFVSVGELVEKKGHQFTLMALAQCLKLGAHVQLIIYGDGLLSGALSSITNSLGITQAVQFRGIKPRQSVLNALREEADAFILPCVTSSTGDVEGIPVPIEEAMSLGLPIISTYHGGIPEIVTNDVTGILTAEKDVDALAKAMMKLATNRRLAFEMGQNGRTRALNDLGQDIWLGHLITIIEGKHPLSWTKTMA